MSNVLSYVMDRICGRGSIEINRRVLEVVFRDEWMDRQAPTSLENKILNWVIKDRVIRDIDLIHGEEILVELSGIQPYVADEYAVIYVIPQPYVADEYAVIYVIPPEKTNFREIVSAINVSYVPFGHTVQHRGGSSLAYAPVLTNDLITGLSQVMNSVSSIPNISSARVDLVGQNTVRITDRQRLQQAYILRCYVVNDGYLNNIPPRAYDQFAELCVWAVKAYCFNKMEVEMGDHYLQRGKELGVFKDVIMRWENASEEYFKYLRETWSVVAYISNEDAYTRFISDQITMGL